MRSGGRPNSLANGRRFTAALIAFALLMLVGGSTYAQDRRCDGPSECCPAELVPHMDLVATVQIGVVMMGITNISEKTGTWDADFYLYERWRAVPGFTPQTEVVNEGTRHSTQFDTTELEDGFCQRSRRLQSTLRQMFNLRRFPFDEQRLLLEFSDDQFTVRDVRYADAARALGFDLGVRENVPGWKVDEHIEFSHQPRNFALETGAPAYDYASVAVPVSRYVTYHLTKYFLPLLVIVVIAFSVFWVDAEDLSSQVTIGVTCVLAAIAFQLAEASCLPEVSYLTLADRVYAVSYLAIGLAVLETIYSNGLARRGKTKAAAQTDRWCRVLFPAALVAALATSATLAFVAH
jgi:hypothetical protein